MLKLSFAILCLLVTMITGRIHNVTVLSERSIQMLGHQLNSSVIFINGPVSRIEDNAFARFQNLSVLVIENGNLTSLNPRTFTGLDQLRVLHLEANQIVDIQPNTFASKALKDKQKRKPIVLNISKFIF
jgi:hypothetical protein